MIVFVIDTEMFLKAKHGNKINKKRQTVYITAYMGSL